MDKITEAHAEELALEQGREAHFIAKDEALEEELEDEEVEDD